MSSQNTRNDIPGICCLEKEEERGGHCSEEEWCSAQERREVRRRGTGREVVEGGSEGRQWLERARQGGADGGMAER